MAKCRICKATIPDGTEYCKNCLDKEKMKANETYLDSLLNSVKNNVPDVESIYKKKNAANRLSQDISSQETAPEGPAPSKQTKKTDLEEIDDYKVDLSDIEDFDQYFEDNESVDSVVSDEELFGESLSDMFLYQDSSSPIQEFDDPKVHKLPESNSLLPETDKSQHEISDESEALNGNDSKSASAVDLEEPNEEEENGIDPDINELLNSLSDEPSENINSMLPSGSLEDTEDSLTPESSQSNVSDFSPAAEPAYNDMKQAVSDDTAFFQEEPEEFEQVEAEEDDFLSLLNQMAPDDPVTEDVKAISDLLQGKPANESGKNAPSDVGEVFSDALKAVSSLHDPNSGEEELLNMIPDPKDNKRKKKQKKQKKQKEQEAEPKKPKKKKSKKSSQDQTDEQQELSAENKPKKGLLKRLFGNVPDPNAAKKKAKDKLSDENAAANEAVKKGKGKASKQKKGASANELEDEDALAQGKGKVRSAEDKGEDKKAGKKEKKEKKKKTKEIIQVIDEIEEDEGRINRLGAGIVFLFFGLLVALLLVGTNVISYTLSIQHATDYFDKQKYNDAYNEVYGIDIKAEDIVIYDKIMTVMFVNKQLNSYNNYYSLGEYPEALDSLLKGLKRYDKYIEFATIIGIKTDLDYVRGQILAELKNVFNLSEKDAMKIIAMDNMEDYSSEVYNVVLEKMNN